MKKGLSKSIGKPVRIDGPLRMVRNNSDVFSDKSSESEERCLKAAGGVGISAMPVSVRVEVRGSLLTPLD